MKKVLACLAAASALLLAPAAMAQQPLVIKPLAEKKIDELPPGPLFWRIENYPSLAQAQASAGRWSLAAESAGKAWLFTLGPAGGATPGGSKVVEFGPIPRVSAPQYLLRINEATGTPGSVTPVHSHPGSEAFYVLAGEQSIRSPHGVMRLQVGRPEAGHGADVAMQVSSTGSADLHSLVMFVVDATRPFSSPAKMPGN
jgi:hypothetical protein